MNFKILKRYENLSCSVNREKANMRARYTSILTKRAISHPSCINETVCAISDPTQVSKAQMQFAGPPKTAPKILKAPSPMREIIAGSTTKWVMNDIFCIYFTSQLKVFWWNQYPEISLRGISSPSGRKNDIVIVWSRYSYWVSLGVSMRFYDSDRLRKIITFLMRHNVCGLYPHITQHSA